MQYTHHASEQHGLVQSTNILYQESLIYLFIHMYIFTDNMPTDRPTDGQDNRVPVHLSYTYVEYINTEAIGPN